MQNSHVISDDADFEDAGAAHERVTITGTNIVTTSGDERSVGVHNGSGRVSQFVVNVRSGVFRISAVPNPCDVLACGDPGPRCDPLNDAPTLSVVGSRRVVVEVEVPTLPAIVVA